MDSKIIAFAIKAHQDTNHLYAGNPYSVHLAMVVHYAYKYIGYIPLEYRDKVIHACWLHDTIEDCRLTYNDIKEVAGEEVAELVYALTNEKGRNRKERANEKYYNGIKSTLFAKFIKLCDRLANAKYSADTNSKMLDVYKKECQHFLVSLGLFNGAESYSDMVNELNSLLWGEKQEDGYKARGLVES